MVLRRPIPTSRFPASTPPYPRGRSMATTREDGESLRWTPTAVPSMGTSSAAPPPIRMPTPPSSRATDAPSPNRNGDSCRIRRMRTPARRRRRARKKNPTRRWRGATTTQRRRRRTTCRSRRTGRCRSCHREEPTASSRLPPGLWTCGKAPPPTRLKTAPRRRRHCTRYFRRRRHGRRGPCSVRTTCTSCRGRRGRWLRPRERRACCPRAGRRAF
mmetsp:Transcript_25009/g.49726  ORF Transcript_25009/g.49726 Transcript_25009/m.49726 type:complete len:215 (-) Transcript_25009:220-864(-)